MFGFTDTYRDTACVAMSAKGIIVPFWFENQDGETEMVNKELYVDVVRQFLGELRRRRDVMMAHTWYQQNGATPHTSNFSWNIPSMIFYSCLFVY